MKHLFALSIMAGVLSACGGGQSGAVPNKADVLNPTVKQTATATLRIEIPTSRTSSARKAQYISPATQSIAVTPAGGARQVFALTPTSPNCTAVNNGGSNIACTLQISAPVAQNEAFIISTYASTDASGTALSTVTSIANIVLGQNTNINATLNGVVASLSVAINPNSVAAGTATSVPVIVTALDAAGKAIIGPGAYADANGNPVTITLSDADPSHSTTLAPMSLTAPGQAATLSYNGHVTQNLYVANSGGGVATINVYPQPETVTVSTSASGSSAVTAQLTITPTQGASGNVAPARAITGSNVGLNGNGFVGNITVDSAGNLYVAVGNSPPFNGYVQVYASGANGNAAPVRTLVMNDPNGEFDPTGLAIDNSRGELYVEDTTQEAINVYASGTSGNATPLRTISGSNTGINNGSVLNPPGIALDSVSGDLYVLLRGGSNKTVVFSQGANGNATPARTINVFLNNAIGAGVGPVTRDYYEVNNGDASVNVFAPTANGNDQPVSRILGSNTALASPGYLALDDSENIYVQNFQNDNITIYAPGANGNVMPVRTIAGANTGNFSTKGIAIGP